MTNSKIRNFFETLRHCLLLSNLLATMNGTLEECRVLYADKSEDYLKLDDFTAVDVISVD